MQWHDTGQDHTGLESPHRYRETPVEITLRPATEADRDFLWWLQRATLREYVTQTWGWDEHWQRQRFYERFDPPARQIVMCDGEAIGCLSVLHEPSRIFLSVIEIAPRYQGRGIGTALIRTLLDEAEARGVPVELQVLRVNPAVRLYERLGFVVTQCTETHRIMRWRPALLDGKENREGRSKGDRSCTM
jgi:ribosomal protein S18 acetylase RimI-like enzyme